MKVKNTVYFKNGNLWMAVTEYEDGSLEKRWFPSEAHAQWYVENMIGGMKNDL